MSHDQLSSLFRTENEFELVDLLHETGVIAKTHQCKYCGGAMHIKKQGNYLYWICQRRVNGVKYNRGKISIRHGTWLDNSNLTVQNILWIVWHFVHHLSEKQCKENTHIGQKK